MKSVLIFFLLLALISLTATIPTAFGEDIMDNLLQLLSNPRTLMLFLIQLCLGLGLGYFSIKALKYIIAIVCILIIGVVLNIWQIGGLEQLFRELNIPMDSARINMVLSSIASVLGLLTVLPTTIGFLIGVIVASRK